jgi:hypothetical protein
VRVQDLMDEVLMLLGFLASGSLLVSLWVAVTTVRRRRQETQDGTDLMIHSEFSPYRQWVDRASHDRRQGPQPVLFPIRLNGQLIMEDRRVRADRRSHRYASR